MKRFHSLSLLIPILLLTSCARQSIEKSTVNNLQSWTPGVFQLPVVAELEVDETKYSYTKEFEFTDVNKDEEFGLKKEMKLHILNEATTEKKVDFLFQPTFHLVETRKSITITVEGYPARYKKFRSMTEDDVDLPSRKQLDLEKGSNARSLKIIEAETELLERVRQQGFANAELGPRRVVVDHNRAKMDVTLVLNPGPKVLFGDTTVVGNAEVEARFVRRLLEWIAARAPADPALLDASR